ncbi:MAG: STAS domain-containing protein [Treponema sp.]|nr:STAS domain-containing protein [Treponema sp.]
MTITKNIDANKTSLLLEGRLDNTSSVDLENEIASLSDCQQLILDFEKLDYISSAGLRILLRTYKEYSVKEGLIIKNTGPQIMEIFEITGFKDIFNIQ